MRGPGWALAGGAGQGLMSTTCGYLCLPGCARYLRLGSTACGYPNACHDVPGIHRLWVSQCMPWCAWYLCLGSTACGYPNVCHAVPGTCAWDPPPVGIPMHACGYPKKRPCHVWHSVCYQWNVTILGPTTHGCPKGYQHASFLELEYHFWGHRQEKMLVWQLCCLWLWFWCRISSWNLAGTRIAFTVWHDFLQQQQTAEKASKPKYFNTIRRQYTNCQQLCVCMGWTNINIQTTVYRRLSTTVSDCQQPYDCVGWKRNKYEATIHIHTATVYR